MRICGCGTVGRAVASDTRYPLFESSQWQFLCNVKCIEKTNILQKAKRDLDMLRTTHICGTMGPGINPVNKNYFVKQAVLFERPRLVANFKQTFQVVNTWIGYCTYFNIILLEF